MGVQFTRDAEKARLVKEQPEPKKWEYLETDNLVKAVRTAKEMGWKEHKVQVRYVKQGDTTTYYVEPFEDGCGCRGMLKYKEFFD